MTKGKKSEAESMNGFMDQMARMQDEMRQAQDQLADERLTITAGGAAVTVVIDGRQRVHQISLSPEALAQGDVELLQDLLVVAINDAIEQSQMRAAERLQVITGRLDLPGL